MPAFDLLKFSIDGILNFNQLFFRLFGFLRFLFDLAVLCSGDLSFLAVRAPGHKNQSEDHNQRQSDHNRHFLYRRIHRYHPFSFRFLPVHWRKRLFVVSRTFQVWILTGSPIRSGRSRRLYGDKPSLHCRFRCSRTCRTSVPAGPFQGSHRPRSWALPHSASRG